MNNDALPDWLEEALSGQEDEAPGGPASRLSRQLGFLLELDKAKQVFRRTYVTDGSRRENDAEHMWHAALAALLLAEHAAGEVDPGRLMMMLAIHDIVEIDAGDTFIYDGAAASEKTKREQQAAERLFGMLPADQQDELRSLWDEFEERQSATARMAAAIDRLLPLLMNRAVAGRTWAEAGITADRVLAVNAHIEEGSPRLWQVARRMLEAAVRDGVLAPPA